jgi:hypothetical protein
LHEFFFGITSEAEFLLRVANLFRDGILAFAGSAEAGAGDADEDWSPSVGLAVEDDGCLVLPPNRVRVWIIS